MLEGEPLEEIPTQFNLGTNQPLEVGQVITIFLMSFPLHLGCSSLRSHRDGGLHGQNPGHGDPKGPGSGSSP